MVCFGEKLVNVDHGRVDDPWQLGIVVIVEDHEPPSILWLIEPALDRSDHFVKILLFGETTQAA